MSRPAHPFELHLERLRGCVLCPEVFGPPVVGPVRGARVFLLGQAPGPRERDQGSPFVWTAGTTVFKWFASIGVEEALFRERVYMGAVIRCFPGKMANGRGDRRPAPAEIETCARYFEEELRLLKPELVLAVGKMAMERLLPAGRLDDLIGRSFQVNRPAHSFTCVPLPHPSGLNRWIQTDHGKALLREGLEVIARHPAWSKTFTGHE